MNVGGFRVPGSSANLGPGFDALSLALGVYLRVEVDRGDRPGKVEVIASGIDSDKIPLGDDNLIIRVLNAVSRGQNRSLPAGVLRVRNEIPLARGLGSSAAAIIAGITSYELLTGDQLSVDQILIYASEFESHPDNLAACLLGGLVVSAIEETGKTVFSRVTISEGFAPVLIIPEFELSTEKSRDVLPDDYKREDMIFNIQRTALMVAAFSAGEWTILQEAMRDRLHQRYRAPLIPGLQDVLRLKKNGLFGIALSGAGPTVIALTEPSEAQAIGQSTVEIFAANGVDAVAMTIPVDTVGRFSDGFELTIS